MKQGVLGQKSINQIIGQMFWDKTSLKCIAELNIQSSKVFWDICSKRPNVLGQYLIKEDIRAKKCFDKSETETEINVWKGGTLSSFFHP